VFRYFSGFCLENEEELFEQFLKKKDFNVAGFSYGAIKAFKYALNSETRINTLQLFSPAFFQDESEEFKKSQIKLFSKNKDTYTKIFFKNISQGKNLNKYFNLGSEKELEELLFFTWEEDDFKILEDKGIEIEVYLGGLDKIIMAQNAYDFFKKFTRVYYFKEKGHIL